MHGAMDEGAVAGRDLGNAPTIGLDHDEVEDGTGGDCISDDPFPIRERQLPVDVAGLLVLLGALHPIRVDVILVHHDVEEFVVGLELRKLQSSADGRDQLVEPGLRLDLCGVDDPAHEQRCLACELAERKHVAERAGLTQHVIGLECQKGGRRLFQLGRIVEVPFEAEPDQVSRVVHPIVDIRDGSREPVATPWHCCDPCFPTGRGSQRAAQARNLYRQIAFFHRQAVPGFGHEMTFGDKLTGPPDQRQ